MIVHDNYPELKHYDLINDVIKIIASYLEIMKEDIFDDIIDELYNVKIMQNKTFKQIDMIEEQGVKDYLYCAYFEKMIEVCTNSKYLKEKICTSILHCYKKWKGVYGN